MARKNSTKVNYALAVLVGAVGGGLAVMFVTKAIPTMMQTMMENMMLTMRESGCDPAEI